MKRPDDIIKLFGVSNQLVEADLARIEQEHNISIRKDQTSVVEKDEAYYPQFSESIRNDAKTTAQHYEIFYCLERSIREVISDAMKTEVGTGWWDSGRIPQPIKSEVGKRIQKDIDSGTTIRSSEPIDFTTFGELGQIIISNWDVFGSIFNSQKAVERVMANLNTLRGPIAHCAVLAEDEVVRLRLSLRDWFRLME